MPNSRTYSLYTQEAVTLLGQLIKRGRKNRRWTAANLAERAGISLVTLRKIENGDPGCSIGLVFETAALVEVPLFDADTTPLGTQLNRVRDHLALMPAAVRKSERKVDDDF